MLVFNNFRLMLISCWKTNNCNVEYICIYISDEGLFLLNSYFFFICTYFLDLDTRAFYLEQYIKQVVTRALYSAHLF